MRNNIKVKDKYYKHEPLNGRENDDAILIWDQPIRIDKEMKFNYLDIEVKDKKKRTCLLISMCVTMKKNHLPKNYRKTHQI